MTSDVSISETASAASFFLSDGLIVTGNSTGAQANPRELKEVLAAINIPVLIGSGITPKNVHEYSEAHGFIVGSYLKRNGNWQESMDVEKCLASAGSTGVFVNTWKNILKLLGCFA